MIDIHCHILPGVDDGAENVQVSLSMAKAAANEGITKIVASPHHRSGPWMNPRFFVQNMVTTLNDLLKEEKVDLEVLPGQETRIYGGMSTDVAKNNELLTVNSTGRYLLIEFPADHVPHYAHQLFSEMKLQGMTPVIAHPERNQEILEHPEILYSFIVEGMLSQVTAASLIGINGKIVQKRTMQFIENHLTHFVASDAHNMDRRPFYMREAFSELEKEFGREIAEKFKENAESLINGNLVTFESPGMIQENSFWKSFS